MSVRRILQASVAAATLAVCTAVSGCGDGAVGGGGGSEPADSVTIAYQPGLGYAPLLVAKQEKVLEKKFPDVKFTWKVLNSGSAIRDGILAGEIQVGAGGIGPFIVGQTQGVPWKIVTALDDANLHLMVKDPKIKTLADLKGKGKIAMPGPDSIQAVVLRKAAEKELGDPKALDSQIVAMGHPDGLQSLASGQVAAHLTSPPFQGQEKAAGARKLVGSYDVFGQHTFNSVYVTESFQKSNKEVVDALRQAVADAAEKLESDPDAAAKILVAEKSTGTDVAKTKAEISSDDLTFSTKPRGFMTYATFMKKVGMTKKAPKSASELFFPNDETKGGT